MAETVDRCLLCGRHAPRPFDRRTFRGHTVVNWRCGFCGLVYQSPRPDAPELEAFYAREYRALYEGETGPGPRDLAIQAGRADGLLHFVRDRIPPPKRHLDVGCSTGALLRRFRLHFGCRAVGVEPDEAHRAHARAHGLAVVPRLEDLRQDGVPPFDLVSLIHVLEHLPDPPAYLSRLRAGALAPGGWLLLEVPNLYAHNCFEVAHLFSFSPHTLRETLRQAGFEVVEIRPHGQPRSVVLPLYLTVLARPAAGSAGQPEPVRPEHGVALKRRAGLLRRRALQRLFPDLAWLPMPGTDERSEESPSAP